MIDENDDFGESDPLKDFPFEGVKLTNAYFLERVSEEEYENYFGKPVDWKVAEEDVLTELKTLKAESYERPPQYVQNIGSDYADFFYLTEEGNLIVLSYAWPFKFKTAWLTSNGESILENMGIPINTIKQKYQFNWRKYNVNTGELLEDYVLGDEGFRLLFKKSPELTQRHVDEAMGFLRNQWQISGGYTPSYNTGDKRNFYERLTSTHVDFKKLFGVEIE